MVEFVQSATNEYTWTETIFVDSKTLVLMTLFTPVTGAELTLTDPRGEAVDLAKFAYQVRFDGLFLRSCLF
jgi:hypothetical protein